MASRGPYSILDQGTDGLRGQLPADRSGWVRLKGGRGREGAGRARHVPRSRLVPEPGPTGYPRAPQRAGLVPSPLVMAARAARDRWVLGS
jgi:hypothetical protein